MNERNDGRVVPFSLSSARLRRGATDRRRRGQNVEAAELLRRAAWQEDSSAGWLALAQQLRQMGCWEQAADILLRLLARDVVLPDTWLELARCMQRLGRLDLAEDCRYHYLQEDPYGAGADEARRGVGETDRPEQHGAMRLPGLISRGIAAWRSGRRELGMRRLRRALRMGNHSKWLLITMAMMFLEGGEPEAALRACARAQRQAPDDLHVLTTLSEVLYATGRPRMSRGILRRCGALCDNVPEEEMFLRTARRICAPRAAERFLTDRLRRLPHRVPLLNALAALYWESGRRDEALRLWQRVLRLDPDDYRARALLKWAPAHPEETLPGPGLLPAETVRSQLAVLVRAVGGGMPPAELLRYGSQTRSVLDCCFRFLDARAQMIALSLLLRLEGGETVGYLRELLMLPSLQPEVCQRVLASLAEMGYTGPMQMIFGSRIMQVQCQPDAAYRRGPWKRFLPTLLMETRLWDQSPEIVGFAADLWPLLSREQREAAAGNDCICWAKALEILYLQGTGQEEAAACVVEKLDVSLRRVRRILRSVAAMMEIPPEESGADELEEEHSHEVH